MIGTLVRRFGFIDLGVDDLDAAVQFYSEIGQLGVTERRADEAFLTGGFDHHWLRLHRSDRAGDFKIGFEMMSGEALDEAKGRLAARGVEFTEHEQLLQDWVDRSIRFRDPDGIEIELFAQMAELPLRPFAPIVHMTDLLHAVWVGADARRAHDFYNGVLGFKASDWIENRMVFMRAGNAYHHSLGIGSGGTGTLDHFCVLVDSLDDVMRARANALQHGIQIRGDLMRHAASGSISIYMNDPVTGIGLEFCTEHAVIDDEGYRPRILRASAVTGNVWLEPAATGASTFLNVAPVTGNTVPGQLQKALDQATSASSAKALSASVDDQGDAS